MFRHQKLYNRETSGGLEQPLQDLNSRNESFHFCYLRGYANLINTRFTGQIAKYQFLPYMAFQAVVLSHSQAIDNLYKYLLECRAHINHSSGELTHQWKALESFLELPPYVKWCWP